MTLRCSLFALLPLRLAAASGLGFEAYMRQYGKAYVGAEAEERRALFESRLEEVERLNARPDALWTAGINGMSDLRNSELKARRGYSKALRAAGSDGGSPGGIMLQAASRSSHLPKSFDWRNHGPTVISPVKDQGACGSCWAFVAAEMIESHVALSTGKLLSLSTQQLLSCTPNPQHCGGNGGCTGAITQLAFNYTVSSGGLSEMQDYPYRSGESMVTEECQDPDGRRTVATITGYVQLPRNDAAALIEALFTVGPISISVATPNWMYYAGGIFDECDTANLDINHVVQLVGYGSAYNRDGNITKFWTIRNSWSRWWGEDGYMRLRRHYSIGGGSDSDQEPCGEDVTPQHGSGCDGGPSSVEVCGECGILSDSTYPVGAAIGWAQDVGGGRRLAGMSSESSPTILI